MIKVSKQGISVHIKHGHPDKGYDFKEILIGHRSFLALLGFIIGAHLVGRSLWEVAAEATGLFVTALFGILIFLISGMILHEFRDIRDVEKRDRDSDESRM